MTTIFVFSLIALVLIAWLAIIYNRLISLKNRCSNAFSQIEVYLVRRLDLIPNLVSVAKQYMNHESETLLKVVQARQGAKDALEGAAAQSVGDKAAMSAIAASQSNLNDAMSKFSIAVEAYPDLKASANMMQLNEELISTENQVGFARQAYNDAATAYNEYKQSVPALFFAKLFGHGEDASLLNFSDRANLSQAPVVNFQ